MLSFPLSSREIFSECPDRPPIGSETCFAPGRARTDNPMIRSHILYPIELRVRWGRMTLLMRTASGMGAEARSPFGARRLAFGDRGCETLWRATPSDAGIARCLLYDVVPSCKLRCRTAIGI